jgi:hypothetical protein
MEIPLQFHPAELRRKATLFFKNCMVDFDLRFPEGRRRRLIELALESPDQNIPQDWQLEEFRSATSKISLLDWPVLLEWNERWQQIRTRLLVHQATNDSHYRIYSGTSKMIRVALHRLAEIESLIRSKPLPENPPLLDLLVFRWKFSALRDEADYLVDRLKSVAK